MVEIHELLLRARVDVTSVETWVEAGWLVPDTREAGAAAYAFSDVDVARACLIRDLREDLGVNDEGVAVVLGLVDQVHGLRMALHHLASAVHALPEPVRREAIDALRAAARGSEADVPAGRTE